MGAPQGAEPPDAYAYDPAHPVSNWMSFDLMNALDNFQFPTSNTGEDEGLVTRTVVGKMKIHHSASHPSHLVVPVLPSP